MLLISLHSGGVYLGGEIWNPGNSASDRQEHSGRYRTRISRSPVVPGVPAQAWRGCGPLWTWVLGLLRLYYPCWAGEVGEGKGSRRGTVSLGTDNKGVHFLQRLKK